MRKIKLTGREANVIRAIGFAESKLGSEILEQTRMDPEDITDVLNGLISVGLLETAPFLEEVGTAEMPATAFEINPGYVHELKGALVCY